MKLLLECDVLSCKYCYKNIRIKKYYIKNGLTKKLYISEFPSHDEYNQVVRSILDRWPHLLKQDYSSHVKKRKNVSKVKVDIKWSSKDIEVCIVDL